VCVKGINKLLTNDSSFFGFALFWRFPVKKLILSGISGYAPQSLGFRGGFAGFLRWPGILRRRFCGIFTLAW